MNQNPNARVGVVGAGPGDPGLITVRGRELLASATVVILDDFLVDSFAHLLPKDAEKYVVGRKVRGFAHLGQEEACDLLVDRALRGKSVVRLKTGDPFLFGTGCEELIACRGSNLPVEIVPGVSRLFAGPALAGVPLLLRGVAGSVLVLPGSVRGEVARPAVVEAPHLLDKEPDRQVGIVIRRRKGSGEHGQDAAAHAAGVRLSADDSKVELAGDTAYGQHIRRELESPVGEAKPVASAEDSGIAGGARLADEPPQTREEFQVDWAVVCRSAETLVFEAVENLAVIRDGLLTGGRSATEPVALIRGRGTVSEVPLISTVEKMEEDASAARMKMPVTAVVGDVVALREHIAQFTDRPLQGIRIALTAQEDAESEELDRVLRLHGARPMFLPMVQHTPLSAIEEIVSGLREDFARADVLVVDSPRGARLLAASLERSWLDWRVMPATTQVVGVGAATSRVLEERGLRSDSVERSELSADAVLALVERSPRGLHVLLAGIEGSLRQVGEDLLGRGASILDVPLADTQKLLANALALKNALVRRQVRAVAFSSPEDVRVAVEAWGSEQARKLLRDAFTIAWDVPTAQALRAAGIAPDATAPRGDADSFVAMLCERADGIRG